MKNIRNIRKWIYLYLVATNAVSTTTFVGADDTSACPLQCFNNGECAYVEEISQFYCECPIEVNGQTFTGIRCETPTITCRPSSSVSYTCLNDSTCNLESSSCNCPEGFSGQFCEFGPVLCLYGSVCYNGAFCLERHNSKTDECVCLDGFSGKNCETIDPSFSMGAIIGISIGSTVGVLLLFIIMRRCFKRCRKSDIEISSPVS